jgi:hypothetical protein
VNGSDYDDNDDDDNDEVKSIVIIDSYNMNEIIYADDIPVEDESLEIQDSSSDLVCFNVEPTCIDSLLAPNSKNEYNDSKSPLHTISDCGYESQGSPSSLHDFSLYPEKPNDDLNVLLNELFPTLA